MKYSDSYFYYPEDENATYGFRISSKDFIVTISDTLELKVGWSVKNLLSRLDVEKQVKYYDGASQFGNDTVGIIAFQDFVIINGEKAFFDALFGVTFNPDSKTIISIGYNFVN